MIQIGDRVKVGKQIGKSQLVNLAEPLFGTVVDIIPGHRENDVVYRDTMYRIRFEGKTVSPTLTPTPNESWIDSVRVVRCNDWE